MKPRENFASRLGFVLIAAGCAVGLGNVWRFPYIVGQYGGAFFVLLYLFFLLIFGLPIMMAEFAVGRASKQSIAKAFEVLEPEKSRFHFVKYPMIFGNYLLMMLYTTMSGWIMYYVYKMAFVGDMIQMNPEQIKEHFSNMLSLPSVQVSWMILAVLLGFFIVSLGLQKGVERITKWMMSLLFLIMIVLAFRALTLDGAFAGVEFYLKPNIATIAEQGIGNVLFAALGQSFFTLSLGIGAMAIFGSYINKEHTLAKEATNICLLDTIVALLAGLIVIPTCFAFGVKPDAGPSLVFITLPNMFTQMPFGRIFGSAFFLFLSFAALSTIVAVFENIVAFWMDSKGYSRRSVVLVHVFLIILLSLPCALGFNLLSDIQPFGKGSSILDLEDFIVSNVILPLGSICFILFCNHRYGFGQDNFFKEVNIGKGFKIPTNKIFRFYLKWILPCIVFIIFIQGIVQKFV